MSEISHFLPEFQVFMPRSAMRLISLIFAESAAQDLCLMFQPAHGFAEPPFQASIRLTGRSRRGRFSVFFRLHAFFLILPAMSPRSRMLRMRFAAIPPAQSRRLRPADVDISAAALISPDTPSDDASGEVTCFSESRCAAHADTPPFAVF